MNIKFNDAVLLDGKPRLTKDGYLTASAKIARTGIQAYSGARLGKPELETVRLYRPEGEVFNDAAMGSIAHKPMTNDHPADDVTAKNWRELSIGIVGAEIARDGEYIRVPLTLMDAQAITDYENGKKELSLGYTSDLEWTSGVTKDGEEYDAIQRKIRVNHLALVDRARAGSQAKIGDGGGHKQPTKQQPTGDSKMGVKIIHDGITIEVSEQAAEVIAELNKRIAEAQADTDKTQAEIDAKDAEIKALKDAQLTPEKLTDAVNDRVALIADAKKLVDQEYKGTSAEVKKQALVALLGDSMQDKSEAYTDARFEVELERLAGTGDQQDDQNQGGNQQTQDADKNYRKKLTDAWRGK